MKILMHTQNRELKSTGNSLFHVGNLDKGSEAGIVPPSSEALNASRNISMSKRLLAEAVHSFPSSVPVATAKVTVTKSSGAMGSFLAMLRSPKYADKLPTLLQTFNFLILDNNNCKIAHDLLAVDIFLHHLLEQSDLDLLFMLLNTILRLYIRDLKEKINLWSRPNKHALVRLLRPQFGPAINIEVLQMCQFFAICNSTKTLLEPTLLIHVSDLLLLSGATGTAGAPDAVSEPVVLQALKLLQQAARCPLPVHLPAWSHCIFKLAPLLSIGSSRSAVVESALKVLLSLSEHEFLRDDIYMAGCIPPLLMLLSEAQQPQLGSIAACIISAIAEGTPVESPSSPSFSPPGAGVSSTLSSDFGSSCCTCTCSADNSNGRDCCSSSTCSSSCSSSCCSSPSFSSSASDASTMGGVGSGRFLSQELLCQDACLAAIIRALQVNPNADVTIGVLYTLSRMVAFRPRQVVRSLEFWGAVPTLLQITRRRSSSGGQLHLPPALAKEIMCPTCSGGARGVALATVGGELDSHGQRVVACNGNCHVFDGGEECLLQDCEQGARHLLALMGVAEPAIDQTPSCMWFPQYESLEEREEQNRMDMGVGMGMRMAADQPAREADGPCGRIRSGAAANQRGQGEVGGLFVPEPMFSLPLVGGLSLDKDTLSASLAAPVAPSVAPSVTGGLDCARGCGAAFSSVVPAEQAKTIRCVLEEAALREAPSSQGGRQEVSQEEGHGVDEEGDRDSDCQSIDIGSVRLGDLERLSRCWSLSLASSSRSSTPASTFSSDEHVGGFSSMGSGQSASGVMSRDHHAQQSALGHVPHLSLLNANLKQRPQQQMTMMRADLSV